MQNIEKNDWEKLEAQLTTIGRMRDAVRTEHHRVMLDFLYWHTEKNRCFTETIVAADNGKGSHVGLKMAYALGEMPRSPIIGHKRPPLPVFFVTKPNFAVCYASSSHGENDQFKGLNFIRMDNDLLDDPTMLWLLEQKLDGGNTDPEISIPEGLVAFRFQGQWAAGGHDGDTVTLCLPLEAQSLEEGFQKLRQALRFWQKENHFGNFWVAQPDCGKWQKLTVEPSHANFMPFVSQIYIDELKLVGKEG